MIKLFVKYLCLFIVIFFAISGYAKEPLQPVTIQLDWVTNVQFAGILLAKEKGWYEEAGIDLTIKGWQAGISYITEVVDGKAQIGVAEGAVIIESRIKGDAIRAFGVQFQKSPLCIMSKKERGINEPKDLVGKKLGVSTPKTEVMTKIVLADKGIKYEEIIPVQTKGDLQFLIDDKVDAFTGFMNNQPLIMESKGYKMNYIPAFKYGYDFYSGVFFTTDRLIKENPKLIHNFLDVSLRGWKEAIKDPGATAKLVVEKFYPEGSVTQQTESLKIFKHLMTVGIGENLVGYMEKQFWQKGIDILYQFKQIDKKIPANDVFTLEFLKQ